MKKFIMGLLVGVGLMLGTFVFADAPQLAATVRADFGVSLNGKTVKLNHDPVIIDGSMFLPLKDIAQATGLSVAWNDQTMTAELSTKNEVPPQSAGGTVGVNTGSGGSTNMTTSDGLPLLSYNGSDYVDVEMIIRKYYDKGYDFKFDAANHTVALIFSSENGHPIDKYQTIKDGFPVIVINGSSCINADIYQNNVLPLIK